jgi:hypothetical protein
MLSTILVVRIMDGSKCPLTTPKVSSTAFKIGVIAFVVQDAAEKILISSGLYSLWFTPCTIFELLPGAVSSTLSAPLKPNDDSTLRV